jgi:hypothetical protein
VYVLRQNCRAVGWRRDSPHSLPNLPFEKIAADILTYQSRDYLVVVDYFSKWIELVELKNKDTTTIIKKLKNIFITHGIPKILIADNMPFNSLIFKEFSKKWNFQIITSSPHYPKSNGLVKKAVHIAKQLIKKKIEENKDLDIAILEYRCTPIPGLEVSPAEILMDRLLRSRLPISNSNLKPKISENIKEKLVNKQIIVYIMQQDL